MYPELCTQKFHTFNEGSEVPFYFITFPGKRELHAAFALAASCDRLLLATFISKAG